LFSPCHIRFFAKEEKILKRKHQVSFLRNESAKGGRVTGSIPITRSNKEGWESNGALRRAKRGKAVTNRSSVSKADGRLRPKAEAPIPITRSEILPNRQNESRVTLGFACMSRGTGNIKRV